MLPVSLPTEARYRPDPYLRPLLETLDEHERHGVVLLDRQQARLFSVFLGEIEEHREAFAALDVLALGAAVLALASTGYQKLSW